MALFGRKKDEDEDYDAEGGYSDEESFDDEEEERESLEERRLKRKLRDLKSENRKKRKEPSKPWGKRERLLVFIILGVTVFASAILTLSSRGIGKINFSGFSFNLSLPDFRSLNPFKEETIEIRKE